MSGYAAVMFDWMLTLADYPDERTHLRCAHDLISRHATDDQLDELVGCLRAAAEHTDVKAAAAREDCSPALHRSATMLHLERAGIDGELANAMYGLLGQASFHPIYPDVADTLEAISGAGIQIAVISDIHVDLREHAHLAGIGGLIDHWILSFEHGVQKPDPAIFHLGLAALGTEPEATLMVGDRASHDGAAAKVGIDTLILPVRDRRPESTRLEAVLSLLLH